MFDLVFMKSLRARSQRFNGKRKGILLKSSMFQKDGVFFISDCGRVSLSCVIDDSNTGITWKEKIYLFI
jgi:hypothetical protein